MARDDAIVVLYLVDLAELRSWVACRDEERYREAVDTITGDDDPGWEGELVPVLERLLRRVMFAGALYEGLDEEDRYYLTQLLIDLFDEFVDHENVTEDLSHSRLLGLLPELKREEEADRLLTFLLRGRELNGDGLLWRDGDLEENQPFMGFVSRKEAPALAKGLAAVLSRRKQGGARPPAHGARAATNLLKQVQSAAEESARSDLDLVSQVWIAGS